MDKTLNLAITGPEEVIDALVKQNGWTEASEQTKEQKACDVLRAFIMQSVAAYNINIAQQAAMITAEAQTTAALDLTTMILTTE